jgi:hypothetical protein
MQSTDWESVLQFVTEPTELYIPTSTGSPGKPVADRTQRSKLPLTSPQIPTPPVCVSSFNMPKGANSPLQASHAGSPADDSRDGNTLVSVSTTFYPGAPHDSHPEDLVLLSNDSIFFYVHTNRILKASENGFNNMIPPPNHPDQDQLGPILPVSESSIVLNIILHTIYNLSCAHYAPSFHALESAVIAMKNYGMPIHERIANSTHLYNLLMSHASLCPLELYALAASNDLYDLAASTSSHLLSLSLASLSDDMAERIGPVYLKRLFFLHFGRADALKRLLISPPHTHTPTQWCDFTEQKKLTRAWALASAYLTWDARPGLSADHPIKLFIILTLSYQTFPPVRLNLPSIHWGTI